jgi:hypothetical protein
LEDIEASAVVTLVEREVTAVMALAGIMETVVVAMVETEATAVVAIEAIVLG